MQDVTSGARPQRGRRLTQSSAFWSTLTTLPLSTAVIRLRRPSIYWPPRPRQREWSYISCIDDCVKSW